MSDVTATQRLTRRHTVRAATWVLNDQRHGARLQAAAETGAHTLENVATEILRTAPLDSVTWSVAQEISRTWVDWQRVTELV